MSPAAAAAPLVWAAASSGYPGEDCIGDQYLVAPRRFGALVAVVDGLGHGPEAFEAAEAALATLAATPEASLPSLIERCHVALERTRGVAMTLASVANDGELEWLGVGNVEAVVVRAVQPQQRERVLLRGGIVGYGRLPVLRTSVIRLHAGDLLAFATDGIATRFADALDPAASPDAMAGRIQRDYATGDDDALIVVARFEETTP